MTALITTAGYKTYAGITGTNFDSALDLLVVSVGETFREMAGRDSATGFLTGARTEYYDGNGTPVLILKEAPITAITSVSLMSADGQTASAYASTEYRFDTDLSGRLFRGDPVYGRFAGPADFVSATRIEHRTNSWGANPAWPEGINNIKVIYTGGYSTIPTAMTIGLYKMVDYLFANRGSAGTMASESLGEYSYRRRDGSSGGKSAWDEALEMLDPWMPGGA